MAGSFREGAGDAHGAPPPTPTPHFLDLEVSWSRKRQRASATDASSAAPDKLGPAGSSASSSSGALRMGAQNNTAVLSKRVRSLLADAREMDTELSSCDTLESMPQHGSSGPHNLTLEYLRNITNNFSDERLLGEGGFGTVYKGLLPNGETVAVKKLHSSMLPGVKDKQFENEARHLKRLKHPNIVLLVGWCSETENTYVVYDGKQICAEKIERLLCLEYMPNGNLRQYLKDESSRLTWETRYKIIKGICYGLYYLHEESQLNGPIVHMDLKPANILLDKNMVPKIADFGLSRLFREDQTKTCTISRDGSLGYMAPEYINRGIISTKSDIFSLGVIIIEVVTGERDYPDETGGISSQEFTELVLKNWRNRLQESLEIDYHQIRRCIQIGLDCVKLDRSKRPTIRQVIKMLQEIESAVQSHPTLTDDNQDYTEEVNEPLYNKAEASDRLKVNVMTGRQLVVVGGISAATVKVEPATMPPIVSAPAFSHVAPISNVASQGISALQTSSPSLISQEANMANDNVQEHKPIINHVQQPVRPGGHGRLLNNLSQVRLMNSTSLGEGATSTGYQVHLQTLSADLTVKTEGLSADATSEDLSADATSVYLSAATSVYHSAATSLAPATTSDNWGMSPATSDSNNHHVAASYLPFEDAEWRGHAGPQEVVPALVAASALPPPPAVDNFDDLLVDIDISSFFA